MNNTWYPRKSVTCKKIYIALKMADISQQYVKTAPKNPHLTSQPRGFVTRVGTSMIKLHTFRQISVSNFHNFIIWT